MLFKLCFLLPLFVLITNSKYWEWLYKVSKYFKLDLWPHVYISHQSFFQVDPKICYFYHTLNFKVCVKRRKTTKWTYTKYNAIPLKVNVAQGVSCLGLSLGSLSASCLLLSSSLVVVVQTIQQMAMKTKKLYRQIRDIKKIEKKQDLSVYHAEFSETNKSFARAVNFPINFVTSHWLCWTRQSPKWSLFELKDLTPALNVFSGRGWTEVLHKGSLCDKSSHQVNLLKCRADNEHSKVYLNNFVSLILHWL